VEGSMLCGQPAQVGDLYHSVSMMKPFLRFQSSRGATLDETLGTGLTMMAGCD
jgi:hypothetical protein